MEERDGERRRTSSRGGKPVRTRGLTLAALLLFLGFTLATANAAGTPAPSGQTVISNAVERAAQPSRRQPAHPWSYTSRVVVEELNRAGKVTDRKEKEIAVTAAGETLRAVRADGKLLIGRALEREREAEKRRRARFQESDGAGEGQHEEYLRHEIAARFDYHFKHIEAVNGRPAYVVAFQPCAGTLPEKTLADRVINHCAGTAWIDLSDFELAKIDVKLTRDIKFWGGLAGALTKMEFRFEKARLEDGTWLPKKFDGEFIGRKLFDRLHVRLNGTSHDFQQMGRPLTSAGE
jgi:hypothetical protein